MMGVSGGTQVEGCSMMTVAFPSGLVIACVAVSTSLLSQSGFKQLASHHYMDQVYSETQIFFFSPMEIFIEVSFYSRTSLDPCIDNQPFITFKDF